MEMIDDTLGGVAIAFSLERTF